MKKIIDTINFYKEGAKGLLKAKFNQLVDGEVTKEVIDFRLNQCKSCPLFTGKHCDVNKYGKKGSDEIITQKTLDDNESSFITFSVNGVVRQIGFDKTDRYTRGCGCPILSHDNKPEKVKYPFSKDDLTRTDGTAACPLNKWTEEDFNKYIDENN